MTLAQSILLDCLQDRGRILIADILESTLPPLVKADTLRELADEARGAEAQDHG